MSIGMQAGDKALAHSKRARIYDFLKENPGATLHSVRGKLNLTKKAIEYNLRVLENTRFVKSIQEGDERRYYAIERGLL